MGRIVIAAISEMVTYNASTRRVERGAHHPDAELHEVPARFVHDDPNVFLLRVEGESVNKIIPDGHLALILPKQKEPNKHDLFAVCVNGHDATIKHVKPLANGLALIPDSHDPTYRPQIFDYADSDCEELTIIGKVIWSCMAF